MESLKRYGIQLVPVEVEDAKFIVDMRTNEKRSRFISETSEDIQKQIEWILDYKIRESKGEEYYFIAIDEEGERFGTYRIYNITDVDVEIGSWVIKPGYTKYYNSIKMDILLKEFVFDVLFFNTLHFEVRKKNNSVLKYHKLFKPEVVKETDMDVFFVLEGKNFRENKQKYFKNI